MSIIVEGPDGVLHEFPDGTSRDVIKRTLDRAYGKGPETQAARSSVLAYAMDKTGAGRKRSAWERMGDNFSNTVHTMPMVEFARSRFTNPLLAVRPVLRQTMGSYYIGKDMAAFAEVFQSKPVGLKARGKALGKAVRGAVDAAVDQNPFLSTLGGAAAGSGLVAEKVVPGTQKTVLDYERKRRIEFATKSDADPFYKADGGLPGKALHGAAALTGVLGGTALDPTSYISAGQGILAKALVQAGIAGSTDLMGQSFAMDEGLQQDINLTQTALSAGAGAVFTGLGEVAGAISKARKANAAPPAPTIHPDAAIDAHFKPELEAADLLAKHALSARDLPDLRASNDNLHVVRPRDPLVPTLEPPAAKVAREVDEISAGQAGGQGRAQGSAERPRAANDGDAWDGVDWGAEGSAARKQAAADHLETLRRTIKPEHAKAFGEWIARGAPRMLGDKGHARVNPDWIDWDSLRSNPDEFMNLESALQAFFRETFDQAGGKAKSWKGTEQAAKTFGTTLSNIVTAHGQIVGTSGEAGVAAKLLALQSVADSHADNLVRQINAMKARLADGQVLPADIAKLAAGVQEATLMDAMAAGASSEIARALNVLKMARQKRRAMNDMEAALDFLNQATNGEGSADLKRLGAVLEQMSSAYRKKGVAGLKDEVRKVRQLGFWDYAGYIITGGVLSAPKSFARNVLGSVSYAGLNIAERYVAAGIGGVRGGADRVTFREANAYAAGFKGALREAFSAGLQAFKTAGADLADSALPDGKTRYVVPFKMTADRWSKWRRDPVRNLPEMLAWGVFSATRTLGFRPSIAMDEFGKTLGRNAQLNALAVREAHYRAAREATPAAQERVFQEVLEAVRQEPTAEALKLAREFFADTGQDLRADFPSGTKAEEMSRVLASLDIRKMAEDHASELVFQKVGQRVVAIDAGMRAVPIIKYFYAPILRTPFALLKAGLWDRSLLGYGVRMHDLRKAAGDLDGALERGGAEGDLALAKLVMGLGLMATAFGLYEKGLLVGGRGDGGDAKRADGVSPYSIKIGDEWVEFAPLSPFAEPFGLVADLAQILGDRQPDDNVGQALVGAVLTSICNNVLNKTTLNGLHQLDQTTYGQGPGGSDEQRGQDAMMGVARTLTSAVPLSSLLRATAQQIDPVTRDTHNLLDGFVALTPGLSKRLPALRDVFGRPIVTPEGERGAFQVLNHAKASKDPLALEMSRLGQSADLKIERPDRTFNDQPIEPKEYGRMLEIQGQLWRHPRTGMNMEEAARALVGTPDYAAWPDERRAYELKKVISDYRSLANRAMKNPRSEFYMAEVVKRTASAALRDEIRSKGLSERKAFSRGRHMGLSPEDANAEIEALRQALDLEDEPQE